MFALVFAAVTAAGPSQVITNEPRIKYLEGEIARTKAHLAKLEKQLAQLKPPPKVAPRKPAPAAPRLEQLDFRKLTVGDVGEIYAGSKVDEIIDPESMIIRFVPVDVPAVIALHPTAGLAEGRETGLGGIWEVVETRKYRRKTYYVIRPAKR